MTLANEWTVIKIVPDKTLANRIRARHIFQF
jgi:hypothetical protein